MAPHGASASYPEMQTSLFHIVGRFEFVEDRRVIVVRRTLRQVGEWLENADAGDAGAGPDESDGEQRLLELDGVTFPRFGLLFVLRSGMLGPQH